MRGLKFTKLLSAEVGRPVVYLPLRGGLGLSPWESQERTFLLWQPGLCQTLPTGSARGRPEGTTRRGDSGSAVSYSFRPPRIIFSSVAFVPVATGLSFQTFSPYLSKVNFNTFPQMCQHQPVGAPSSENWLSWAEPLLWAFKLWHLPPHVVAPAVWEWGLLPAVTSGSLWPF